MKRRAHPLEDALEARVRLLETTLRASTTRQYRYTVRMFLEYLRETFPQITKPSQLRRDPHLLGWLEHLWKRRTRTGKTLDTSTRGSIILQLRRLLELLADYPSPPPAGLLLREDVPRKDHRLPRPLSPEDDARLQEQLREATDAVSTALLLQRLTGMRIGECVDLAADCLRHLGDNRWIIHVPIGKLHSERWVPVDDDVRLLVERLAFLRTIPPVAGEPFLLARPKGRAMLCAALRGALREAAGRVGISAKIVPHQLRHTYATSLLRAGVSLPALMKLLGHRSANMTLHYVEVTQSDLQREYHAARANFRHRMPTPPALLGTVPPTPAALPAAIRALGAALNSLEHYRRQAPAAEHKNILLASRRLARVRAVLEKLDPVAKAEK